MSKVSVHLVAWNGEKYIPQLFASLRKQTYRNWQLIVWVNQSTDGTAAAIEHELQNFSISHEFIKNDSNVGFAGGHNALAARTQSEYVLMLNQDMVLAPDCIERLGKFLDTHPDVGAVTPRLMRWDFANNVFTDFVDALGLRVFRNRRVIEQHTGESWKQLARVLAEPELEVFGVSGALPMFRVSAMRDIALPDGNFFDAKHHSYKEDVDAAFRLQWCGWHSFVLLNACAWHDRSAAGPREQSDTAAIKNKSAHGPLIRYRSYQNHLRTLIKNEAWSNFLRDLPFIVWYEMKKFVYFLVFDRKVLAGVFDIFRDRAFIFKARKHIQTTRRVSPKAMRIWWR